MMVAASVVLPSPDGPTRATDCPGPTVRSTPASSTEPSGQPTLTSCRTNSDVADSSPGTRSPEPTGSARRTSSTRASAARERVSVWADLVKSA